MTSELTPDPESISAQDLAFVQSEATAFQGQILHPFSPMRRNAAQALGNRLFCGTAAVNEQDIGLYPGAMVDAVVALYLCSAPKSEVLIALRKPDIVHARAMEWGEERNIAVGTPTGTEALEVYGDMLRQIAESQFDVERDPKARGAVIAPDAEPSRS